MNFLQPLALIALPLMALPILIHLINQYRHRTIPWAAMMFLVSAKRMSKGMARLRHILVMLMRMLAVGALVFAVSRPLASGWLGGVGMSKPDATLILLDRSASMEMQDLQSGESKRSTALKKLAQPLEQGDYGTRLVLIDSASGQLHEVDSPKSLLDLPMTEATATSADIPAMLESALEYLKANKSGRADIWICSDLSENDWDAGSGRWAAIRQEFAQLEGVHHFLLSYTDRPSSNLSVRVENVQRQERSKDVELVLDVMVRAEGRSSVPRRVPIEFEVNNVRSVVEVELDAQGASLQGHRIPIDTKLISGWGSVGLPGDANRLDNSFYFVFSEPPVRKAIIVSEDARIGEAFRRALAIPTYTGLQHRVDVIPVAQVGEIDWESAGLLIWQGTLPRGLVAEQIERFVDAGRVAMFFPSDQINGGQLFASSWGDWQKPGQEQAKISWWRGDADLLAHVDSGDALPLNELRTYQYCSLESSGTALARFGDDKPLLTRIDSDRGGVYFCGTLPAAQFSSLERDGVVFYVMLQRALAEGCRSLAAAFQRDAGPDVLADREWKSVAPADDAPTISQRGLHAGVYQDGEYWAAVNRSALGQDRDVSVTLNIDDKPTITRMVRVPAMGQAQQNMVWTPPATGDYTLTMRIPRDMQELLPENNEISAPISVRQEQLKVLVIESYPRWEYRYLRNALERDPGVEVTCLLFHPELPKVGGGRGYIKRFPNANELSRYDVVFLGDVGVGPKQLTVEQAQDLRQLVSAQAAGLVFIPGRAGWHDSLVSGPLADLYPVVLDPGRTQGVGSGAPGHFSLTESGRRSLLTRLEETDQANAEVWRTLPGFYWYAGVQRAKAGTEILAVHERESTASGRVPLIVTKTYGTGKVLFMGTDSAWRWREGIEDRYHYRFWGQVARWMAYRRQMAMGQSMRLFYSPDRPQVDDMVTLNANVMGSLGGPLDEGSVVVQAISPSGRTQTIRLQPGEKDAWGLFVSSFIPKEPGNYRLVASSAETGASIQTNLSVQCLNRERKGRLARFDVLDEIARITRAKLVPVSELRSLLDYLATLPEPEPTVHRTRIWSHPLWGGFLVLLLGLFWTARKMIGAL